MMERDDETIAVYDAQAADYSKFTSDAASDPALIRFITRLPQNGSVLDLGCGPGDHAAAMHAVGFQVTATDASSAMVAMSRKHLGIDVRQATFEDLTETNAYDGIWANFSLLHARRADFPRYLANVAKALKPDGILHLGMKTGDAEARDKIGRHYAYYSVQELRQLMESNQLSVIHEATGESLGLAGDIEPWVILTGQLGSH